MKKIFVALPVMTMLISGFSYSSADARSAVGYLPDDPKSNPTSEVKPEEEPKQEKVSKNNNGSAVGHLPNNPESNLPSEVKPEEEPKQEEVAEDKVTVNNLKAGNDVTIEGHTMEMAPYYEIYVNEKPVIFTVKNKVNPRVYSTKVLNLNKGDIVTVYASYMDATSRYIHGSVTTIVQ